MSTSSSTFDSTKRPLKEILLEIQKGKTQLPDFQRGWVWDDDRIKSLLASISMAFPIGALMTLEAGGDGVRFKPRRVAGTSPKIDGIRPEILILDGQQRLTSLYQALLGDSAVDTKDSRGKKLKRWYYIDMKTAVSPNGDREDAVFSVPENRMVKTFRGDVTIDLSTRDLEYDRDQFPATHLFDPREWRREYQRRWKHDPKKTEFWDEFEEAVVDRFKEYQIPVIQLTKETPKEAVCLVFEKVNTGGVSLTVFELLTAAFAAEDFQLRDDWRDREARIKQQPVLQGVQSDDFLQAVTLMVTMSKRNDAVSGGKPLHEAPGISCKRREILKLSRVDYESWADRVEKGFLLAARFLHRQKIFKAKDVPYRTQIVPLATMFTELGKDAEPVRAQRLIARWYWCGVLGELYGGAIESRFARDLPEVCAMVRGDSTEPITIQDSNFAANRLLTLKTRNSAAYKGLYALLMRDGCRDFRTGEGIEAQAFFDEKIDIHHIFPMVWCDQAGIDRGRTNSIVNKTAISARTNRSIGGKAPSTYLGILERTADAPEGQMDDILTSHLISGVLLRADDFDQFFTHRADALLARIEQATGRQPMQDSSVFDNQEEEFEEEETEWAENGTDA